MLKKLIAASLVAYLFAVLIALLYSMSVLNPAPLQAPDFATIKDTAERKQAFFDFFRPIADKRNQLILNRREQLQALAASEPLSYRQQQQVYALAEHYHLDTDQPAEALIKPLLEHIDIVPTAMVLAQAANESSWGRSRFAEQGNNYFGQWCYRPGCGIVPSNRKAGARHEVQHFHSPVDSVNAYFRNINTHPAYQGLRELRAQMRERGEPLTAYQLVAGLGKYSERGDHYIDELRQMIRGNNLE